MKPKLVQNINLSAHFGFLDWLSPEMGPLPDIAQLWDLGPYRFKVALWDRGNIHVAVELLGEETLPDHLRRKVKGWILQFFLWKRTEHDFVCRGMSVKQNKEVEQTYKNIIKHTLRWMVNEEDGK